MKSVAIILLACLIFGEAAAEDARPVVDFPPRMQAHMLANMRDHLAALSESIELITAER